MSGGEWCADKESHLQVRRESCCFNGDGRDVAGRAVVNIVALTCGDGGGDGGGCCRERAE